MAEVQPIDQPNLHVLADVLELGRRARAASSAQELGFLLVNNTHALAPYRQAALWLSQEGVRTLSGVVQAEANAPYVLWLELLFLHLATSSLATPPGPAVRTVTAEDLPEALAAEWAEWWPAHALWLAMPAQDNATPDTTPNLLPIAALLLVRDEPWPEDVQAWLREWSNTWWHAFHALHHPRVRSLRAGWTGLKTHFSQQAQRKWWQQNSVRWGAVILAMLCLPVRLTVLAPGELVPSHPLVVRAPLDGVVDAFHIQPNQVVKKGQPLFSFDEVLIQSKLEVAEQTLATAETEFRQASQQALLDAKYRAQLALLQGKIEEKHAEVEYLRQQLLRARVLAPGDGVALLDDPSEWIGKPISTGERIMRIAEPADTEVEAWLPLADAVALEPGSEVTLYLNASPLSPVAARVRYMAHDAVQRPDGMYAYRVRATLAEPIQHRVGLKGTAKLYSGWVPVVYWMMRRPLAFVRTTVGI